MLIAMDNQTQPTVHYSYTKTELLTQYWECVQKTISQFGDKPFIVTTNGSLTFREADQQANIICAQIKQQISQTGNGIGLFIKDPLKIIPAMIGVLRSGNYFVPLDITFPDATILTMIETADIKVVLTGDHNSDRIFSLARETLTVIKLGKLENEFHIPIPEIRYSPEDIIQILFTSGSTGNPKGAIEDYRYLTRAIFLHLSDDQINSDDRQLQLSTFTFSGPHMRVFTALVNGHTLYYYDLKADGISGLPGWIKQHEITVYNSTPTVFRGLISILDESEQFPSIRKFSLGGEKRLQKDILAIKQHFPNVDTIRLGFASTETQRVSSSIFPINHPFDWDNLPSGIVEDDIQVFIWDENGVALPQGSEGEIVIYGDSLARGYINNQKLTQERFLPDPQKPGWQYFKTGDLGKLLSDRQLAHLGRIDNMVKIKGVRIELDSIENHILSYPGIIQVATKAFDDAKSNKRLAAYFVPEKDSQIPISDLRKYLTERLPRHLQPHYLVQLDDLPLTGNGKVARSQLPLPQLVRPELSNPYVAPKNFLENELVRIWEDEIGVTGIGVTDDFFDIGGDSLIGVLLFMRVEETLKRKLPVSILLTASTIRKQAELIENQDSTQDFSPIIKVNEGEHLLPLFFIPGKGGYPTRIRHLAKKIDPRTPIYAMQDLMASKNDRRQPTIESAASFYLNEIRKLYPRGPYLLVGESMGGKIAFEMAQQLLKLGEKVPVLALLDTYNFEESPIEQYKAKLNLPYYWMLLNKHTSILTEADWQGKLEYLKFYRENFAQKISRFFARRLGIIKKNSSVLPDYVFQLEQKNRMANQNYIPQPFPGRVILFKATRGPNSNTPTNGWGKISLGELVIHPLDCYHGSILFEPTVSKLAKIIQHYINDNSTDQRTN